MKMRKLIIEIPEDFYKDMMRSNGMSITEAEVVINAYYKSKAVPLSHGRILEDSAIIEYVKKRFKNMESSDGYKSVYDMMCLDIAQNLLTDWLKYVPAIIEEERGGSNNEDT